MTDEVNHYATVKPDVINPLALAVIHEAKNSLGEVILKLEARGDCALEMATLVGASHHLTNLLLWYRHQAGEMRLNIDSASPIDLLEALAAEVRPYFAHLTIRSDTRLAPTFWFYDAAYLRMALTNALHNACKFAHSEVRLTVATVGQVLVFTIADDGAGYSNATLTACTQPMQLAEVTARGTGLGLALARTIAALHKHQGLQGSVALKNASGAVFTLTIP